MSSCNQQRRDFLGYALGAVATVGGAASLYAMKKTWDPLPSVISAGFTEVDLLSLEVGQPRTVEWRGKPVFILKKSDDMGFCEQRDLKTSSGVYNIAIGICTHLGCIPSWNGGEKKYKCACHGGEFDPCGKQIFGPPPRPFDIPPFSVKGEKIILGEEGPEYKKMIALRDSSSNVVA